MARYEIPEGYSVALVATMPRSGTWYSFYFLEFLDLHLSGRKEIGTRLDLSVYPALALGKVHLHTICPGFLEGVSGPERDRWDALDFYGPVFNFGYDRFIRGNEAVFSPALNPAIRIVYLYRNPLDQAVSYFRHVQRHRQETARSYLDSSGNEVVFTDARHYLHAAGAAAYIKQYFTFHAMRQRHAEQILMLPYERLVRDPAEVFAEMLAFLRVPLDSERRREAFRKALNSCSPKSLRALESAMDSSLGRDQADPEASHMRGGEIGKWKEVFGPDDVAFVAARLSRFGLSLEDFTLE